MGKKVQLTAELLRDLLEGDSSRGRVSAPCASPGAGKNFVVTAGRTKVYGAPFASLARRDLLSRLERGQPFHLGADAYRILGSFRERFTGLLERWERDPEAHEDAFALSIESHLGLECFYGTDAQEVVLEALQRLPGDLVVLGRWEKGRDLEVGRKVGGAAKDLAALRQEGMTLEGLEALERAGNEEALASINKDTVFPAIPLEDLRAKGVPPAVAYIFTEIHRSLARRPAPHPASRAVFVSLLPSLLGGVLTSKQVAEAQGWLLLALPDRPDVSHRRAFGTRFWNLASLDGAFDSGPWERAHRIEAEPDEEGAWDLTRRLLHPRAEGQGEDGEGTRREEQPLPARRKHHLDDVRREGPPVVFPGPQDLLDRFGLTGLELGNWVAREEGRRHLSLIAGALQDLEEVLGLDLRRLARSGNLALALGSRGKGSACAHYEPKKRVINLTKTACDGSVAHEFAHFLDHLAGLRFGNARYGWCMPGYLSEEKHAPHDSPLPLRAMARLFAVIQGAEKEEEVTSKDPHRWYREEWVLRWLEEAGGDPQAGLDRICFMLTPIFRTGRNARDNSVCLVDSIAMWLGRPLKLRIRYTGSTEFYEQARAMGGYWQRRRELFARAFESFVEDELLARSRLNEYLVEGTRGGFDGCRGRPYPRGEERRRINESLRELLSTLKEW